MVFETLEKIKPPLVRSQTHNAASGPLTGQTHKGEGSLQWKPTNAPEQESSSQLEIPKRSHTVTSGSLTPKRTVSWADRYRPTDLKRLHSFTVDSPSEAGSSFTLGALVGQGSYAYVYALQATGVERLTGLLVVKIPKSSRSANYIMRETLLVMRLMQYHNQHPEELYFPLIQSPGLIYLTRRQFSKIRYGETLPSLVLRRMAPTNLEDHIIELRDRLKRDHPDSHGVAVGLPQWWMLFRNLIQALQIMQRCLVVHGDIKSENILLDAAEGVVKGFVLSDFSASSMAGDEQGQSTMINATLQFIAPELLIEPQSHKPSHFTDLYSCGLVLLHAAIGKPPYYPLFLSNEDSTKSALPSTRVTSPRARSELFHTPQAQREPLSCPGVPDSPFPPPATPVSPHQHPLFASPLSISPRIAVTPLVGGDSPTPTSYSAFTPAYYESEETGSEDENEEWSPQQEFFLHRSRQRKFSGGAPLVDWMSYMTPGTTNTPTALPVDSPGVKLFNMLSGKDLRVINDAQNAGVKQVLEDILVSRLGLEDIASLYGKEAFEHGV